MFCPHQDDCGGGRGDGVPGLRGQAQQGRHLRQVVQLRQARGGCKSKQGRRAALLEPQGNTANPRRRPPLPTPRPNCTFPSSKHPRPPPLLISSCPPVFISSSPRLLISSSPHLLVSSSPRLLVSSSPHLLISSSPHLFISSSHMTTGFTLNDVNT
eukprot:93237-Prorocentrum_minimum.AAC.8